MQLETQIATDQCHLKAALLVYERSTHSSEIGAMATVHHVMDVAGKPMIAPGRHMTVEDYDNLVRVLNPNEKRHVWRDNDTLFESPAITIWWTPPRTQSVFFKVPETVLEDAKGSAPMPGIIWVSGGGGLDVYAFKGTDRPTRNTKLYQAPFFNVSANGDVCTGNAGFPRRGAKDFFTRTEAVFFASHFTHPNVHDEGRLIQGHEPHQFWRDMLDGKYQSFPEDVLVPIKRNAGDLMPKGK